MIPQHNSRFQDHYPAKEPAAVGGRQNVGHTNHADRRYREVFINVADAWVLRQKRIGFLARPSAYRYATTVERMVPRLWIGAGRRGVSQRFLAGDSAALPPVHNEQPDRGAEQQLVGAGPLVGVRRSSGQGNQQRNDPHAAEGIT